MYAVNDAGISNAAEMWVVCERATRVFEPPISFCSTNYEFRPSAGGKRPEFTSPLRDQFGAERGDVKFECEVSAEPRAEIQWLRGSKELADTPKYSIFNKGATQTLLIRNLHVSWLIEIQVLRHP